MAQPPMSDRENGLGWCMGAEVKKLAKTSWKLIVVSMVLFCIGQNAKCCEFRGQLVGKVCGV